MDRRHSIDIRRTHFMADNLMQTRFGSREICNVVFKAKSQRTIGNKTFEKGEPVYIFDSLKTSSLESAATSVYATGGRGNSRLVAWDKSLAHEMQ